MIHKERWHLLTWWFKTIIVFYTILSLVVLFSFVISFFGFVIPLGIYGLSTTNQYTLAGLVILLLFSLKGVVGVFFLIGHRLAPYVGIVDSIIGIFACIGIGLIYPFFDSVKSIDIVFRLELILLIPFFLSSRNLTFKWLGPFT